jgi:hypothetical protein
VFLIGVALAGLVALVALVAVPHSLDAPAAAAFIPPGVVALLVLYASAGWALRRRPSPADAASATIGLLAGVLWSCEIFAGGPARLSPATERAVGGTFALAATLVTLSASWLVAHRHPNAVPRWRSGALAGLTSALVLFVFSVSMTLLTLGTLGMRSDYRHQFLTSGARTMDAFLVQDILTGASAHLVINLILGLAGAGIATALAGGGGMWLRRGRPTPDRPATPPS